MKRVLILNYGAGNLFSVARAFEALGALSEISEEPYKILRADLVVLPGVGHFSVLAQSLEKGLGGTLMERLNLGGKILGICLGMHILYEGSQEAPGFRGMGIFPGEVLAFPQGMRVPHLGWNTIRETSADWLRDFRGKRLYFAHSYYCPPPGDATTEHEGIDFASVIKQDGVIGIQFHPEKSGPEGLEFLRRILSWK
ncbi:MAG: imidazole glycerol phosphate synthase subunit HisH [candidate division WOR-3 bacterium]